MPQFSVLDPVRLPQVLGEIPEELHARGWGAVARIKISDGDTRDGNTQSVISRNGSYEQQMKVEYED